MNFIQRALKLRDYGIVYTVDYKDMISLMVLDLNRRGFEPSGEYAKYLKDNYPNRGEVIDYLIRNAEFLGYSGGMHTALVDAKEMMGVQQVIAESAIDIVRTTQGTYTHIPTYTPSKDPEGEIDFGGYRWTVLHTLQGSDGERYSIIRMNDPQILRYHSSLYGYWRGSEIRTYLEGDIYNSISASDRSRIVPVTNHTSYAIKSYMSGKAAAGIDITSDMVWLESYTNIMGTSWVGGNYGAATCDEPTIVTNVAIGGRFDYYTKNGGNIGTGIMRRLRTTGGIEWDMACPANGTTINTKNNGDFFGVVAKGACYPCVCIRI